ncbi:hypothetical protein ACH47B_14490 [Rhodococcus sp. NPDC019627]|uniref:hypothetical protein n=1 Tax=unclassified Rhodococcus (in: high G+C Gram-positive bacteria) TaxID=192944 RepID=UPI0033C8E7DA
MQPGTSKGMKRLAGGAACAAAAAAAVSMAMPATASAATEVAPPTVVTEVDGNTLDITVTNPNVFELTDPQSCGAVAFDATRLPEVLSNPAVVLQPGFAAWMTPLPERVVANATGDAVKTFTTSELADGAYAVIGECLSLSTVANPQTTMPQIVFVGGPLDGIQFGS